MMVEIRKFCATAGALAVLGGALCGFAPAASAAQNTDSCVSSYTASKYSSDVSMYNDTDQPLTLLKASHYGTGEHWAAQPPATIAPHTCADMSGYETASGSGDNFSALTLYAEYALPNGDVIPFSVTNGASDTAFNTYGITDVPYVANATVYTSTANPQFTNANIQVSPNKLVVTGTDGWSATSSTSAPTDDSFRILSGDPVGANHIHVALKLEPTAAIRSYPLTSSPITIPAGGNSETFEALCGVGYAAYTAATASGLITFSAPDQSLHQVSGTGVVGGTFSTQGTTSWKYQAMDYAIHNGQDTPVTTTMTWTCAPQ